MKPSLLDRLFALWDVSTAVLVTVAAFSWWLVAHSWRGPVEPEEEP